MGRRHLGERPGAIAIVNVSTNLCLDVYQNGTGNGTWTDVWPCTGQDNQKWTLEYLGTSLFDSAATPDSTGVRSGRLG